ncbi:MAG: methyltransferase domain-containing protein [Sphingopyxis sp.]
MKPWHPLAHRTMQEEEMDATDLPDAHYARVLGHLSRINRLTLAARPTLAFVRALLNQRSADAAPLKILDVGFGHGDMLRAIARLAQRMGHTVELIGVDLNPRSEMCARAATADDMPIRWLTGDYRDLAGQGWDVVISSLVAHHMSSEQRHDFLHFMENETVAGWLVNDLHRKRLSFIGYPALATLAMVDPIVRRDGQLSIARSFSVAEWHCELAAANIQDAHIVRWFPWRLVVERIK